MTLLGTIQHDLTVAGRWLEREVEQDAVDVWNVVKPVFLAVEPQALNQLLAMIKNVLADAGAATSLADLETMLLNDLEHFGQSLLTTAKALESNLLQALIALVKAA